MEDQFIRIILAIIIATLAAIVYSLKVLILMERRVARMEQHIENIALRIMREEMKIERMLGAKTKKAAQSKRSLDVHQGRALIAPKVKKAAKKSRKKRKR